MSSVELYKHLEVILLILVRISCFISFAPLYGGKKVPKMAKIALAAYVSYFTYTLIPVGEVVSSTSFIEYGLYIVKEALTGLAMGYTIYLVLSGLFLAGHIIDFNLGFSMVNVFDPVAQVQVPLVGNFYYMLMITVMLVINADLYFLKSVVLSFQVIPLGGAVVTEGLINTVVGGFISIFVLAVKIASPVLVATFILNVALGILVRAVPQMNMFVVGLPIKLLVGVFILFMISPVVVNMADFMLTMMDDLFTNVIKGMMR